MLALARAQIAYGLTRLAVRIAPDLGAADHERLVARINRYTAHQARPTRLRVERPGGLSTTHGPPAPWTD